MTDSLKASSMRVLLIAPSPDDDPYSYSNPSLGLGYVGASLLAHGHQARLVDMGLIGNDLTVLSDALKSFAPQVVGVTGFTSHYRNSVRIINFIKQNAPHTTTVLGGPHASVLSDLTLGSENNIDFIIRGEGEQSFPLLLHALQQKSGLSSIPGLVYRADGKICSNATQYIQDLDSLEYPWKIINPLDYQQGRVHGFICRQLPVIQVLSSRGCPYNCTFCAGRTVLGSKIRVRQPSKFVDELEYLKRSFGIREIQVADDNFTFYRGHAIEICQDIIKRKLNISWSLPNGVRADRLDEELLRIMKQSGCYYLSFGIEFGSPRMLKITKKSLDLEQAKESIRLASRQGFITQGFFLIGHPEETPEDIELTRKFITSVPLDKILLTLPFPYPGSELFEYYVRNKYGDVRNIDWNTFKASDYVRIFEHTNDPYVQNRRVKIFTQFHLNPFNALRFLSKFRTWTQFKTALYGFQVYLNLLNKKR